MINNYFKGNYCLCVDKMRITHEKYLACYQEHSMCFSLSNQIRIKIWERKENPQVKARK